LTGASLETLTLVAYAQLGVAALALGAALWALLRKREGIGRGAAEIQTMLDRVEDRLARRAQDESSVLRRESAEQARGLRLELTTSFKALSDSVALGHETAARSSNESFRAFKSDLNERIRELLATHETRADALRVGVEKQLGLLRGDTAEKLEEMRKTVAEKLEGTLERRLGESFRQVSDRLEQVHKGLGEMQTLATGVGDLKKVMTNVKVRGTWGEIQLGILLEQILVPEQFERNVRTKPGSTENVEYALKMPGHDVSGQGHIWLPIDAKFPIETYQRLVDAQERADVEAVELEGKQLEAWIRIAAKEICDKYVSPPETTDFAVMYLPTEGLFAEVVRRTGLVEQIQRECRVVVAGPTTLTALLNSLQMGFRTLAIQKRSSEVWEILGAVKSEFGRFDDILKKVEKKLQEAGNVIDGASRRSRVIKKRLSTVQEISAGDSSRLLSLPPEIAGATTVDESADSDEDGV
jgi:DNA recombination protein RmuC